MIPDFCAILPVDKTPMACYSIYRVKESTTSGGSNMEYTYTMEEYNEMHKLLEEGKITASEWADYCIACLKNIMKEVDEK